jgi:hypothetical protein
MRFVPAVLLLLMVGCAADRFVPEERMTPWTDGDTSYCVEDTEDGFKLYIWHERFQFFRSSATIEKTGKQAMYNIADEIAEKRKRKIEELSDRKIKSDVGRTFWAVTSWSAMARVFWKGAGSD